MENVIDLITRKFKNLIGNDHSFSCGKETTVGHIARTPLLFLFFMLCCMMASAQQVEVTLTEAGTLRVKIASDQKYTITSLKVSGPINGSDVRYLREMAGRDCNNDSTDGKLVELDLSDANIVVGGDHYYGQLHTKNNVLGDNMFYKCRLVDIKLPNSVTSIGWYAFRDCSSLTSVTIPNSVTEIGDWVFPGCSSLTSVTIPNSVTSIGNSAFYNCSSLTSVTIPNSVTSIGNFAFYDCSSLTSVIIPNSVTSIGNGVFSGCSSLTSVTIPNSVTSIGNNAFGGCSSLTSVTIPNSVTSIDNNAFGGCSSLTSITIPNSVTSIGGSVFCDCSSLTSVTIGNSVTSIVYCAFSGCSSLTSVTIPNSVTEIGDWVFSGCSSLTSVTIGKSVTSIGWLAFNGCYALVKLTSLCTTPPTCGSEALADINKQNCTLYVPKNSLSAYKAADQWKDFYNMKEVDPTGISLPNSNGTDKVVRRYDTNGHLMDKSTKGLNILKMGDGTTKKVWVK